MKKITILLTLCLLLVSCGYTPATHAPTQTAAPLDQNLPKVPLLEHVVLIILENRSYSEVIGSSSMPELNALAQQNVLLTQYHAVAHPSLPNYIALIGGSTYGIHSDCTDCFINQVSLPDLIEQSGHTWKTYQEDLPKPCFVGNQGEYVQKHDPFIYFDPIRTNPTRCQQHVVPLTQLSADLQSNSLPNFAFIMPNLCHSGHDCHQNVTDQWVKSIVDELQAAPALGKNSLIFITFDEGVPTDSAACCGLPNTGGHVAAVLISPLARASFQDNTPYTHYSFLKTILQSWALPALGETANPLIVPIQKPWIH